MSSFFDSAPLFGGEASPADRRAAKERKRRKADRDFRWRLAIRNRHETWTDEEIAEENIRLEAEILARIEAGQVTVCPPSSPATFFREDF